MLSNAENDEDNNYWDIKKLNIFSFKFINQKNRYKPAPKIPKTDINEPKPLSIQFFAYFGKAGIR